MPRSTNLQQKVISLKNKLQNTFGSPPIPSAISRAKEPVDTTGTFLAEADRPSHMIDPFPNEEVI